MAMRAIEELRQRKRDRDEARHWLLEDDHDFPAVCCADRDKSTRGQGMCRRRVELPDCEIGQKVKDNAVKSVADLALEMAKHIIQRTPFDTGNAKGAWVAGVNSVPTAGETPNDEGGAATLARIAAVINTAKVGDVHTCVNGANYAAALEYGRSEQAPAGMVRVTLLKSQSIANTVAGKLR